jgi:hypothetical protein
MMGDDDKDRADYEKEARSLLADAFKTRNDIIAEMLNATNELEPVMENVVTALADMLFYVDVNIC